NTKMIIQLPQAILEEIISYCGQNIIIHFQKKLPRLLRSLTCTKLKSIIKSLHYNVRILNLSFGNHKTITDKTIQHLSNLTKLNCAHCHGVTGDSFSNLINLMKLNCSFCQKITSHAFENLVNLTDLLCFGCSGLENISFANLTKLKILNCQDCPHITNNA